MLLLWSGSGDQQKGRRGPGQWQGPEVVSPWPWRWPAPRHMKHNMAVTSQALLMLLEAENAWCPGLGAWLAPLGQESVDHCDVCYPTTLDSTGFSPL